ncbi:MAG: SulP family inorganic anion transporter [Nodosilinea sp.]
MVSDRRSPWHRYLPMLQWLPEYRPAYLVGDLTAGMIVASLLVPQSMAYALLAGLPAQVGLYASITPPLLYGLLGSSRVLAVGPVAVDSLMVGAAIAPLAAPDTPQYLGLALTIALVVGLLDLALGVLRLGFLVNFLSRSVISGFMAGAAVIIALSQVKHLLGLSIPNRESVLQLVPLLITHLGQINPITVGLGLASGAILLYCHGPLAGQLQGRGWSPQWILPLTKGAPLLVVILGTLVVYHLHLDQTAGVRVVGEIPAGLPPLTLPQLDLTTLPALLPVCLAIALVGYMEGFAGGQALASKRRERVDPNQELIALGIANLGAALGGGYPVTGGVSRSVVNFSAGAHTGLASVVTGGLVALTVVFFTPLFYFLPQTCLAAIIITAVYKLIDLGHLQRLWAYDRADALAWLVTFATVMALGVQQGVIWGGLLALGLHLWRTSHPHIAIVGRLGQSEHFRNVQRHPVTTSPEVLAVRLDESLYFANAKYLETFLNQAIADHLAVKKILLVCSAINLIDASALEILEGLVADLQDLGIGFYLSEVKGPVMDRLVQIGFIDFLGADHLFLTTDQAMRELGGI